MGGSIAEGLLRSGQVPAANLWLANPHPGKLARFQEQGAHVVTDNTEAVKEAQVVFLCVKPWLAEQVLQEMIDTGTSQIENSDLRAYYGVGAPTPMPFEYDIVKINTVNGHVLRAYGLLGLGHREQALQEIEAAKKLSPNDFRIYAFEQIKDTF